jgi:hypothetical protein
MKAKAEFRYPVIKGKVCRLLPYSLQFACQTSKGKPTAEEQSLLIFVKGFGKLQWTH